MDSEIEELRRKQQNQVLAKPKIIPDDTDSKPAEKSSELTPIENPPSKNDNNNDNNFKPSDGGEGTNEPKITGGEDSDPAVRLKRDHVKGVNNFLFVYFYVLGTYFCLQKKMLRQIIFTIFEHMCKAQVTHCILKIKIMIF